MLRSVAKGVTNYVQKINNMQNLQGRKQLEDFSNKRSYKLDYI